MTIGRHGAADLGDDVLVAVAVEIGEGDAVALVQLAGAGRSRDARRTTCPALFSSSSCGKIEANDGLPMPRYMSR